MIKNDKIVVSGCAPEDNRISAAIRGSSDWLNDIGDPPPDAPWRLKEQAGLTSGAFPKLTDVPPKPDNMPAPDAASAKIAALRHDNAMAGLPSPNRPDAAALGGPMPPEVKPLDIPGVGMVGGPRPQKRDARAMPVRPAALPVAAVSIPFDRPDWFDTAAKSQVADFARNHADLPTRILIVVESPEFSVDPAGLVRDQLLANGISRDRISVSYAVASEQRITLQRLNR